MQAASAGSTTTRPTVNAPPMVDIDTDTDTEPELGTATIVYETPGEDVERVTVDNDRIAYFQDHWLFAYGTDDDGNDVVRRVPRRASTTSNAPSRRSRRRSNPVSRKQGETRGAQGLTVCDPCVLERERP